MFHDILLETTPAERRRRKLTLLASILGEALVMATVIAVPLLYLDAIPGFSVHAADMPTVLREPAPIQVIGDRSGARAGEHSVALLRPTDQYVVDRTVADPHLVASFLRQRTDEVTTDPNLVRPGPCCESSLLDAIGTAPPQPVERSHDRVMRISEMQPGMIVRQVNPVYPTVARQAGVHGEVVLRATIGADGQLENLQVVSGHPMLIPAATDAVRQWRFRPYYLNGSPIEVQAQVTVRFILGGN